MKPISSLSNGFTRIVELDTGTYRMSDWVWLEFEITGRAFDRMPESVDQYLVHIVDDAITKSREEGREHVYLGKQTQREYNVIEGCLVFGYPGDYEQMGATG